MAFSLLQENYDVKTFIQLLLGQLYNICREPSIINIKTDAIKITIQMVVILYYQNKIDNIGNSLIPISILIDNLESISMSQNMIQRRTEIIAYTLLLKQSIK